VGQGEYFISSGYLQSEPSQSGEYLADRNGKITRLMGFKWSYLSAMVDPIDGRLWLGVGRSLLRVVLVGTVPVSEVEHLLLPENQGIVGVGFDEDGHLLLPYTKYFTPMGGGLYRVDRHTGAPTLLQVLPDRIPTAFDIDPVTHRLYWHLATNYVSPLKEVFELDPPYAGPSRKIVDLGPVLNFWSNVNGLAFAPRGPKGELYASAYSQTARIDLATGQAAVFAKTGDIKTMGGIIHDPLHGDCLLTYENGLDFVYRLDLTTAQTQMLASYGFIGRPNAFAVNGYLPGTLACAPMHVDGNALLLELGVWGRPGDIGVIAITKPIPILLGVGVLHRGGNYAIKLQLPAGTVTPGRPGAIEFMAASIDPTTHDVLLTPPKAWPKN
jgi:hypothetical protein